MTHDDHAYGSTDDIKLHELNDDDETIDVQLHTKAMTIDHLSHHVPKCRQCPICCQGKETKTPSHPRRTKGATVNAPDSEE